MPSAYHAHIPRPTLPYPYPFTTHIETSPRAAILLMYSERCSTFGSVFRAWSNGTCHNKKLQTTLIPASRIAGPLSGSRCRYRSRCLWYKSLAAMAGPWHRASSQSAPRPPQPPCQLHILRHERNALSVDSAQIRVLKQMDQESLSRLLKRKNGRRLPPQLARSTGRQVRRDFADLVVSYSSGNDSSIAPDALITTPGLRSKEETLTTLEKGSLAMSKSVLF